MQYKNRKNVYDIHDGVVYVYRENGDYVFCADEEDIPLFSMYSWHLNSRGYAVGGKHGHMGAVHKLILQCEKGATIDHISRNKQDNRKSNLRICSYTVNNRNRGEFKHNTSGAKGVFFDKWRGKGRWRAVIGVDGKNKYLGCFKTFEEAKAAREAAEIALGWNDEVTQ